MLPKFNAEKGAIPLLILIAGVGLIAFLAVASIGPFRNTLLSTLFPKDSSFAYEGNDISVQNTNLNLSSNFNSTAIELFFEGDSDKNAKAKLEFKKDDETNYKKGLDLWPVYPTDLVGLNPNGEVNTGWQIAPPPPPTPGVSPAPTSKPTRWQAVTGGNEWDYIVSTTANNTQTFDFTTVNDPLFYYGEEIKVKTKASTSGDDQLKVEVLIDGVVTGDLPPLILTNVLEEYTSTVPGLERYKASIDSIQVRLTHLQVGPSVEEIKVESLPITLLIHQKRAFYGSALLLDPGTCYDFKVTVTDYNLNDIETVNQTVNSDGACLEKKDKTIKENIPVASTLTPTHYVNGGKDASGNDLGNDLWDGTQAVKDPGCTSTSICRGPWKTLKKAVTAPNAKPELGGAPANAVVQVAPGFYVQAHAIRSVPIKLIAEFPAVDDNRNLINNEKRSVIMAGTPKATVNGVTSPETLGMSCPTGTAPADCPSNYIGVWEPVTNVPAPGLIENRVAAGALLPASVNPNAKVWKWVNKSDKPLPVNRPLSMGYATSKYAEPLQIAYWDLMRTALDEDMDTPAEFIEKMLTNKSYNYGFANFDNNEDGFFEEIYLRLPVNAPFDDPNKLYITLGGNGDVSRYAIRQESGEFRLSGFEVRQFFMGVFISAHRTATLENSVIDHNFLIGRVGVNFNADQPSGRYRTDNVIQYNVIKWSNMRNDAQAGANNPSIPWEFVKRYMTNADGSLSKRSRIAGLSEGHGVDGYDGGGKNIVVRYNTIDGTFDGIAPANQQANKRFNRYAGYNLDAHDNLIQNLPDDPLEPGPWGMNYKFWNNTIKNTMNFVSIDPTEYGPGYIFRNTAHKLGSYGVAKDGMGKIPNGSNFFKHSSASLITQKVYIVNNTFWTDYYKNNPSSVNSLDQATNSPEKISDRFFVRNNIFKSSWYAIKLMPKSFDPEIAWDEDFNYFYTDHHDLATNSKDRVYIGWSDDFNKNKFSTVRQYRTKLDELTAEFKKRDGYGNGANTNIADIADEPGINPPGLFDTDPTPWFVDGLNGNFALKTGPEYVGKLIDMGTPVPNIADCYAGSNPDLGAIETGTPECSVSQPSPSASASLAPTPPATSTPPPPPGKPGDTDGDGDVDIFDLNDLLGNFGKSNTPGVKGDTDADGDVDIFDFNKLLENFGK